MKKHIKCISKTRVENVCDISKKSSKDLFSKVMTLPSDLFQKQTESEYIAIFNNDVEALDSDYLSPIIDIARSLVQLVV
ncbi:hypothetical protein [Erysipelothrix anatis]|uniref:hypothetical protein n=1 Tax=Erysipelothrix anatis TaxID=2683713 RepID=UPI00135B53EF|nr:hypothetical protein [Erysipelothrix anatis]